MSHALKLGSVVGLMARFAGSLAMHGDTVTRFVAKSVAMCDGFVANFV